MKNNLLLPRSPIPLLCTAYYACSNDNVWLQIRCHNQLPADCRVALWHRGRENSKRVLGVPFLAGDGDELHMFLMQDFREKARARFQVSIDGMAYGYALVPLFCSQVILDQQEDRAQHQPAIITDINDALRSARAEDL